MILLLLFQRSEAEAEAIGYECMVRYIGKPRLLCKSDILWSTFRLSATLSWWIKILWLWYRTHSNQAASIKPSTSRCSQMKGATDDDRDDESVQLHGCNCKRRGSGVSLFVTTWFWWAYLVAKPLMIWWRGLHDELITHWIHSIGTFSCWNSYQTGILINSSTALLNTLNETFLANTKINGS